MDSRAIAEAWRDRPVSGDVWFVAENQAGALPGECDGVMMVCESINWRRAYVKPLARGSIKGRAAREKIAADLAFELGIPVPPSILIVRSDAGTSFERHANASLVVYQGQAPWWAVQKHLVRPGPSALRDQALKTIGIDSARAFVFDTWVAQTEHHAQHPHNIILGWDNQDTSGFGFLDYEYAFGGLDCGWQGARARYCQAAPFPEELLDAADADAVEATLAAIEELEVTTVQALVDRIPPEFLEDRDRRDIINGLIVRQPLVREAVRDTLRWREK